jgi:hypothetical protein
MGSNEAMKTSPVISKGNSWYFLQNLALLWQLSPFSCFTAYLDPPTTSKKLPPFSSWEGAFVVGILPYRPRAMEKSSKGLDSSARPEYNTHKPFN